MLLQPGVYQTYEGDIIIVNQDLSAQYYETYLEWNIDKWVPLPINWTWWQEAGEVPGGWEYITYI